MSNTTNNPFDNAQGKQSPILNYQICWALEIQLLDIGELKYWKLKLVVLAIGY